MTKRTVTLPPLQAPITSSSGELNRDWERYITLINESIFEVNKYSVTINPTSVSANTTSEQSFTVSGVSTDDIVLVTKPTHTAGLGIGNVRVSAVNEVSIVFMNCTGSPIDPPSEDYIFLVLKV